MLTFRGSARDGEFWLRQAYDAAKESNSHNGRIIASLHLGDLFTRMSSLESAQEFLSEAAELADHVEKMKESAIMDISFYGFHGRKSLWSDAFRSIIRAESKLRKLLDPGFINSMEKGDAVDWVNRFADFRISLGSPPRAKAASPKATRRSNRFPVTEGIGSLSSAEFRPSHRARKHYILADPIGSCREQRVFPCPTEAV